MGWFKFPPWKKSGESMTDALRPPKIPPPEERWGEMRKKLAEIRERAWKEGQEWREKTTPEEIEARKDREQAEMGRIKTFTVHFEKREPGGVATIYPLIMHPDRITRRTQSVKAKNRQEAQSKAFMGGGYRITQVTGGW